MVHCFILVWRKNEPVPFSVWLTYCSNSLCIYFLLNFPIVEAINVKVTDLLNEPFFLDRLLLQYLYVTQPSGSVKTVAWVQIRPNPSKRQRRSTSGCAWMRENHKLNVYIMIKICALGELVKQHSWYVLFLVDFLFHSQFLNAAQSTHPSIRPCCMSLNCYCVWWLLVILVVIFMLMLFLYVCALEFHMKPCDDYDVHLCNPFPPKAK